MFRKIVLFIIIAQSVTGSLFAQDAQQSTKKPIAGFDNMSYLAWDVSFPSGSVSDFISKTSFSGGTFGYRKMLNKGNVSIGGDISWNSLYEYAPRKTYELPNGAVTTDLYKYVYTLPFGLNAHYYFQGNKLVTPYAGLMLGTTYSQQKIYYNTYVTEDENWGFYIRPEIGAMIKFDEYTNWGLLIGARYNYSTNQQADFKIDNISTISLQLGMAWTW